jgi:hypothetical protein
MTATSSPSGEPARYFATYLDAVRYAPTPPDGVPIAKSNPNGWIRRMQWVILPKKREPIIAHPRFQVFFREQNAPNHRAVWRSAIRASLDSVEADWNSWNSREFYVGHDPIVVEITLDELKLYTENGGKTPWKVLERAKAFTQRQARGRSGYVI